eukprot:6206515-Pleurochrysis_carterae.AAC.1
MLRRSSDAPNALFFAQRLNLRLEAGELTAEEVERLVTIVQNPRQFKVPDWMLNRKKDVKDGKFSQGASGCVVSAQRRPAARAARSVCPRRRVRSVSKVSLSDSPCASYWAYLAVYADEINLFYTFHTRNHL